uniref:Uncharacterized protein n=1 Tax=Mycena chlorophos TaxID=658473 RepID=A0ABQ0M5K2_MYCCL|nr:predicted protein [Mycena chlorophos]
MPSSSPALSTASMSTSSSFSSSNNDADAFSGTTSEHSLYAPTRTQRTHPPTQAGPRTSAKARAKAANFYANAQELLAALRVHALEKDELDFSGSYALTMAEAGDGAPSDKTRVQGMINEVWRATGYRFTVKDHPPITTVGGHKTRLWCSQDSARKTKRGDSDTAASGRRRYACRSRLMIASLPDGGDSKGARVVTVRLHHHMRHETAPEEPGSPMAENHTTVVESRKGRKPRPKQPTKPVPLPREQELQKVVTAVNPTELMNPTTPVPEQEPYARSNSYSPATPSSASFDHGMSNAPPPNHASELPRFASPSELQHALVNPPSGPPRRMLASVVQQQHQHAQTHPSPPPPLQSPAPPPLSVNMQANMDPYSQPLQNAYPYPPYPHPHPHSHPSFPYTHHPAHLPPHMLPSSPMHDHPHPHPHYAYGPQQAHLPQHHQIIHIPPHPHQAEPEPQAHAPPHPHPHLPHAEAPVQAPPYAYYHPHPTPPMPMPMSPLEFQHRMSVHVARIRDFAAGLEYQIQFCDYRMLEVLESEAAPFLRLVEECLAREEQGRAS